MSLQARVFVGNQISPQAPTLCTFPLFSGIGLTVVMTLNLCLQYCPGYDALIPSRLFCLCLLQYSTPGARELVSVWTLCYLHFTALHAFHLPVLQPLFNTNPRLVIYLMLYQFVYGSVTG